MWIAKWKYDRLVERIERLEASVMVTQFHKTGSPFGNRQIQYPVNRVAEAILDHLGMEYRGARTLAGGLVKREKPKK